MQTLNPSVLKLPAHTCPFAHSLSSKSSPIKGTRLWMAAADLRLLGILQITVEQKDASSALKIGDRT